MTVTQSFDHGELRQLILGKKKCHLRRLALTPGQKALEGGCALLVAAGNVVLVTCPQDERSRREKSCKPPRARVHEAVGLFW